MVSLQQQKEQAPSVPAYWERQLCLLEGAEGADDRRSQPLTCINNQITCNSFIFQYGYFWKLPEGIFKEIIKGVKLCMHEYIYQWIFIIVKSNTMMCLEIEYFNTHGGRAGSPYVTSFKFLFLKTS